MKLLFKILLILCCCFSYAQETINTSVQKGESIKPLRIGVKLGVPSLLTINAEYVTPLLDNRVAATIDYMSLSQTVDDVFVKYNNFEIGTNVYLNNTGKGLYGSLSYFSFSSNGTYPDVEFDDFTVEDGEAEINFNTLNVKLGAKLGRVFYFRVEVGYGFGEIPERILVESIESNKVTFEDIPAIPGIGKSGALIFNFGIGFAFL